MKRRPVWRASNLVAASDTLLWALSVLCSACVRRQWHEDTTVFVVRGSNRAGHSGPHLAARLGLEHDEKARRACGSCTVEA